MNGRIVSGVTGAAPIFNDIMRFILQGKEARWQEKPPDVASAPVCPTGFPKEASGNKCTANSTELYWQKGKPSESAYVKTNVWIDPRTGLPPKYGEQVEGLVLEERTILQDPTTKTYCLDCNRPVNEEGKVQYEQNTIPNEISNNDFEGFQNFEEY
jgi:membrane carboxypeptidase/penicillin-binding protein